MLLELHHKKVNVTFMKKLYLVSLLVVTYLSIIKKTIKKFIELTKQKCIIIYKSYNIQKIAFL